MKICWLTDIHLNFVGRAGFTALCDSILNADPDAVLITGDIATSRFLLRYLESLEEALQRKKIYFVLGNHDYYEGSIRKINNDVAKLVATSEYLSWLSQSGPISLTPDSCLIGHEGTADGRLGDPEGSPVELNDYRLIEELRQPSKSSRLQVQRLLGDAAARSILRQLGAVSPDHKSIHVALHVPPFREACWHEGQLSDDNYLPHFACQAAGDVLRNYALRNPDKDMTVYCGHSHSSGYAEILPNLRVYTAGAEYRQPAIARIIDL